MTDVYYEVLEEMYIVDVGVAVDPELGAAGPPSPMHTLWQSLIAKVIETENGPSGPGGVQGAPSAPAYTPSGRILVWDDLANRLIPIEGLTIEMRWAGGVKRAETDENGYFSSGIIVPGSKPTTYSLLFYDRIHKRYIIQYAGNNTATATFSPAMTSSLNVILTGNVPTMHLLAIHRAARRSYHRNYLDMARPILNNDKPLPVRYIPGNNADRDKGVFTSQMYPTSQRDPAIRIYGGITATTSGRSHSDVFSTTIHEYAHATHFRMMHANNNNTRRSRFNDVSKRIKESWTKAVQYYITKLEYSELGHYIDSYEYLLPPGPTGPGGPSGAAGIVPFGAVGYAQLLKPTALNVQCWPYWGINGDIKTGTDLNYSSLIIDLVDDNNQRTYYLYKPNDYSGVDRSKIPNDNVRKFALDKIQPKLAGCYYVSDFKTP